MHPARLIGLINAAATGRATVSQLRELSAFSLPQLLTARKRFITDHREREITVPTPRLVRSLHFVISRFSSHAPATTCTP